MSTVFHQSFFAMNTRCNAVFPDIESDKADSIFQILKKEVLRIESKLSRFIPESEVSRINRSAFKEPVKVSDEVFTILKTCQKYFNITQGAFDITLYPLIEYWNKKATVHESEPELHQIVRNLGMDHIILHDKEKTVTFANEYIEIDLGGFGKGYALEKMNGLLNNFSVENAFISFGESSVLTVGTHPAGDCWKVGVNNYLDPGNSLHTFKIHDGSMSSSSNFYVDDNGKLHNHQHVINPETGCPIKEFSSVSVKATSPVLSEVLSTAVLVSSHTSIMELKAKLDKVEIIKVNYQSGKPELQVF